MFLRKIVYLYEHSRHIKMGSLMEMENHQNNGSFTTLTCQIIVQDHLIVQVAYFTEINKRVGPNKAMQEGFFLIYIGENQVLKEKSQKNNKRVGPNKHTGLIGSRSFQNYAFKGWLSLETMKLWLLVLTKTLFLMTLIIKLTLGNIFIKMKNPPGGATITK